VFSWNMVAKLALMITNYDWHAQKKKKNWNVIFDEKVILLDK